MFNSDRMIVLQGFHQISESGDSAHQGAVAFMIIDTPARLHRMAVGIGKDGL